MAFGRGGLRGLTEPEAACKPPQYQNLEPWGFSGSILGVLLHVAVDSLAMINQLLGDGTLTYEIVGERFQTQGGDLNAALTLLDEGYAATCKTLARLTDCDLLKKVGKTRTWRTDHIFIELIGHYIYHADQINYIRCLQEGITIGGRKQL